VRGKGHNYTKGCKTTFIYSMYVMYKIYFGIYRSSTHGAFKACSTGKESIYETGNVAERPLKQTKISKRISRRTTAGEKLPSPLDGTISMIVISLSMV
jgi:hypothetical protein